MLMLRMDDQTVMADIICLAMHCSGVRISLIRKVNKDFEAFESTDHIVLKLECRVIGIYTKRFSFLC